MKKHRTFSYSRRPKIIGLNKIEVRVIKYTDFSRNYLHFSECEMYCAIGYAKVNGKKTEIGDIYAKKDKNSKYLTIADAQLYDEWTGRGYGHILYWALAKKAKKLGLKGIRSSNLLRSRMANRAWLKIKTHSRGHYDYIKL